MMEHNQWFKVNVITCAAPQMQIAKKQPHNYENVMAAVAMANNRNRNIKSSLHIGFAGIVCQPCQNYSPMVR